MNEVKLLPVERLRKSPYNPRIVHDHAKAKALLRSVKQEGIREPLLIWLNRRTGEYEVLDGSRRLWAAKESDLAEVPCIVLEMDEKTMKRTALTIHLTQEDLTPEEIVAFIERLVDEEEFKSVEDVCRYLGFSKQWYYELRKACKARERMDVGKSIPVSTLAVIEGAEIPAEKKLELIRELERTPLPRAAVRQVVEQLERKPTLTPREAVEQQLEKEPKRIEDSFIEAEGINIYQLKKTAEAYKLSARNKQGTVLGEVTIPHQDLPIVKRLLNEII